eukprot:5304457-Karenia_brevis.AAC.1
MQQRMGAFDGLRQEVLEDLHKMLIYDTSRLASRSFCWKRAYNPYVRSFMYMHELLREQGSCPVQSFKFQTGVSPDPRRYNAPRCAEVAVVYEGDAPPSNRVITVFPRVCNGASQLHRPSDLSDHLDPMTYPVLFPDGQPGWHPGLRYNATATNNMNGHRQKVSMAEFYTHRLMTRDGPLASAPCHYDVRKRITVPRDGTLSMDTVPAPASLCTVSYTHLRAHETLSDL